MGENVNVWVFRVDNSLSTGILRDELNEGRLRQGWGIKGMAIDRCETFVDTWTNNKWGTEESAKKRYEILKQMLEMKRNDVIIIPKMAIRDNEMVSSNKCFTICEVDEKEYKFLNVISKKDDFGHTIHIKPESLRTFTYQSSLLAKQISNSFKGYQKAINRCDKYRDQIIELLKSKKDNDENWQYLSSIELLFNHEYLEQISSSTIKSLVKQGPNSLEEAVEQLFVQVGFEVERLRHHSEGGDADLICTYKIPIFEEIPKFELRKFYIQVKCKEGKDPKFCDGVDQLNKIVEEDYSENSDNLPYKLLITTAEVVKNSKEYSYAQDNNVLIMDKFELAENILKYLLVVRPPILVPVQMLVNR